MLKSIYKTVLSVQLGTAMDALLQGRHVERGHTLLVHGAVRCGGSSGFSLDTVVVPPLLCDAQGKPLLAFVDEEISRMIWDAQLVAEEGSLPADLRSREIVLLRNIRACLRANSIQCRALCGYQICAGVAASEKTNERAIQAPSNELIVELVAYINEYIRSRKWPVFFGSTDVHLEPSKRQYWLYLLDQSKFAVSAAKAVAA